MAESSLRSGQLFAHLPEELDSPDERCAEEDENGVHAQ